jgi:hypothetical protein
MNKQELIDAVASQADTSKSAAEKTINAVLDTISKEVGRRRPRFDVIPRKMTPEGNVVRVSNAAAFGRPLRRPISEYAIDRQRS